MVAIVITYMVLGFFCSGLMFLAFPPVAGYSPPPFLVVIAMMVYVWFWPFIVLTAVGYALGMMIAYFTDRPHPVARMHYTYTMMYDEANLRN